MADRSNAAAGEALRVDRYLADKAFDRMDHALGRPLDPCGQTYRNYYAEDEDSALAAEMRGSPHWGGGGAVCGMAFFHATDEGRRALAAHLKAINDPHRAFVVSFDGFRRAVVSTSPGKAKYAYWLAISDSWSELTFSDFLRSARVRRSA